MMIYVPIKKDIIMIMSNIDQVPSASVCSWFYHGYVAMSSGANESWPSHEPTDPRNNISPSHSPNKKTFKYIE